MALLSAAAIAGCVGAGPAADWQGSVVDSAGVEIVTSPEEGLWRDGEAWRLEEDLRIGDFAGDPRYQFGQVGSIAVNGAGHLLVMDRQVRELRVFSPRGGFLGRMGSPGDGPGEFGVGVTDVFVGPGDTVLVPDVRNRRIHRFSPDGEWLDAATLDLARYRPLRFRWSPGADVAVAQLRLAGGGPEGGLPGRRDQLRRVRPDGTFGDTVLEIPSGGLLGPDGLLRYFTPEPTWALTDSLTVHYGVNDRYRIGQYDRTGTLRRVIARQHTPREISDRDIRAFFAYLDQAWIAAGVHPSRLEANHRRVSFAPYFPAFSTLHTGPGGTLWVQPVRAPGDLTDEEIERYNFTEDFGASDWDVFDRRGRFLGVVSMPPRFQPRLFAGDAIYGVARDDLDVQYVVRLRILRESTDG